MSKKIKNFSKQILEDEDLLWHTPDVVIARFTSQEVARMLHTHIEQQRHHADDPRWQMGTYIGSNQ